MLKSDRENINTEKKNQHDQSSYPNKNYWKPEK